MKYISPFCGPSRVFFVIPVLLMSLSVRSWQTEINCTEESKRTCNHPRTLPCWTYSIKKVTELSFDWHLSVCQWLEISHFNWGGSSQHHQYFMWVIIKNKNKNRRTDEVSQNSLNLHLKVIWSLLLYFVRLILNKCQICNCSLCVANTELKKFHFTVARYYVIICRSTQLIRQWYIWSCLEFLPTL